MFARNHFQFLRLVLAVLVGALTPALGLARADDLLTSSQPAAPSNLAVTDIPTNAATLTWAHLRMGKIGRASCRERV